MSRCLARLGGLFVAPAEPAAFAPPRPRPRPAVAGVLAPEADLVVAAGAVAARLRREAGAASAVVCVWRGHDEPAPLALVPGSPAAVRLAAKLARRGLAARASGTLCVVGLPAAPAEATRAFLDASAAAGSPAVVAVCRREPALDPVLAGADHLVLALPDGADPVLAELAAEGLRLLGPPVGRVASPSGLARHAARLGLVAPGAQPSSQEAPAGTLQEAAS